VKLDGKKAALEGWFESYGLPKFEPEVRFHPVRRWRWDWALENTKIAVEISGDIWAYKNKGHSGGHQGVGQLRDFAKMNAGQILGWVVLQFTPQQMKNGEAAFVIRDALLARGWDLGPMNSTAAPRP
jgi:hypothetical protein